MSAGVPLFFTVSACVPPASKFTIPFLGNNIAVSTNPEGVVRLQAGVERSETPAIVVILYMNPERVTE